MGNAKIIRGALALAVALCVAVPAALAAPDTAFAAEKGTVSSVKNVKSGIKVTWTKNTKKSGYYIYRKTGAQGKWVRVKKITNRATTSWTDTKTKQATRYTYRVRSYKGSSVSKNTKNLMTFRLNTPKVTTLKSDGVGSLLVETEKSTGIYGYQVTYSTSSAFAKAKTKTKTFAPNLTLKHKRITGLTAGKTYYVKVRTMKRLNGKTYYSAYTVAKKVVVMKAHTEYLAATSKSLYSEPKSGTKVGDHGIAYGTKVTMYGYVRSTDKGGWVKFKYKGTTYYTYIAKGADGFSKTTDTTDYSVPDPSLSVYQNAVLAKIAWYLEQPTQYGRDKEAVNNNNGVPDENGVYLFDCSGFTRHVYNTVMTDYFDGNWLYTSNAVKQTQLDCTPRKEGKPAGWIGNLEGYGDVYARQIGEIGVMDLSLLQPGDLLCYDTHNKTNEPPTSAGHVAIYLGNGMFVHSYPGYDICKMPTTGKYGPEGHWFYKAIRVLPE